MHGFRDVDSCGGTQRARQASDPLTAREGSQMTRVKKCVNS